MYLDYIHLYAYTYCMQVWTEQREREREREVIALECDLRREGTCKFYINGIVQVYSLRNSSHLHVCACACAYDYWLKLCCCIAQVPT